MSNYFDEGQKIFYMDDDISQLYQNYNNPKLNQVNHRRPRCLKKIDSDYQRSNNYLLPLRNLEEFINHAFQVGFKKEKWIIGASIP